MNVTLRLRVTSVQFSSDDGPLDIFVQPQYVDGKTIVTRGITEHIQTTQADAVALGAANGRTDGEWSNREVEQLVLADTAIDQHATMGRPAIAPVYDRDNVTVLREGMDAVEAQPATRKPRFAAGAALVWSD